MNKAITIETEKEMNTIAGYESFVTNTLRDNLSNLKKGKFDSYIEFPNGLRIVKTQQGNYKEDPEFFATYSRCSKYRSVLKFYINDKLVGEFPLSKFKALTEAQKIKRLNK